LPDGAMLQEGAESYLIVQGRALLWSPDGYRETRNAIDDAMLLTPPSTLRALSAGYRPVLHRAPPLELPHSLPRQLGAGAERHQFGFRDVAMHRRHAAIGGRDDVALRYEFRDVVDHLGDIFGGLDGVAGNIDHAGLHDLAGEQAEQFQRHPRIAAFDRDLPDRTGGDRREDILILPPLAAERFLPVGMALMP